jgi:ribose/xylose/arabinose/galactoside ABC-type transport system permease subunit
MNLQRVVAAGAKYLRENPLILVIVAVSVVTWFIQPRFLSAYNVITVLRQASLLGILSVGMTFVIVSGGIDLSVGSLMALTSVIVAMLFAYGGVNIWVSTIVGLFVGATSGAAIATLISKFKIAPFLATLAFMGILRGVCLVVTDSQPINGLPEEFLWLGRGSIAGVPVPVLIWITLIVVATVFQEFHLYGRSLTAVGGNEEAARFSGINVTKIIFVTYIINGVLASVTGILYTARLNSGQPMLGDTFELMTIAAVCTGGASLLGGRGKVVGSAFGAILVTILYNAMSLVGLSTFLQQIAVGIILILAVAITVARTSRKLSLA